MRTRIKQGNYYDGYLRTFSDSGDLGTLYHSNHSLSSYSSITDMIGYDTDQPMFLERYYYRNASGSNLTIPPSEYVLGSELRNYFPSFCRDLLHDVPHLLPHPIDLSHGVGDPYAVKLLKETNPSRPLVSLPAFVGELRDLPGSIKRKGLRSLAHTDTLGIRFGMLPLISDILKMLNISEAVDKRSIELQNLKRKGGARVKRTLERKRAQTVDVFSDFDGRLSGSISCVTTQKIWGTCHWIPDRDTLDSYVPGRQISRGAIKRLLLGIHESKDLVAYGRDAWELIPWSWLADWYGNFGDWYDANSGGNLADASQIFIMSKSETVKTVKGSDMFITMVHETKSRARAYPNLAVSAPTLTPEQTLTLIGLTDRHRRGMLKAPHFGPIIGPSG